jgi:hypothetical protein
LIKRLGEENFTYGKEGKKGSGSGLGVAYAKQMIQKWSGTLTYHSQVGVGTTATIHLPAYHTPRWFVQGIHISTGTQVVIIDDDVSVHELWKQRLGAKNAVSLAYKSPSECEDLLVLAKDQSFLFLVDYQLREYEKNGLDFIIQNDLRASAILVTSYFDDADVMRKISDGQIQLLPKFLISQIEVVIHDVDRRSLSSLDDVFYPSDQLPTLDTDMVEASVLE